MIKWAAAAAAAASPHKQAHGKLTTHFYYSVT
jgi:hypothetical protein